MRSIEISDEVWDEIAKRGRFGEAEEDVLRRVFDLAGRTASARPSPGSNSTRPTRRSRMATRKMSSFVADQSLVVDFHGGPRQTFALADRADKKALRRVRNEAVDFAREAGASYGQVMAVKKALTEAGYHLTK